MELTDIDNKSFFGELVDFHRTYDNLLEVTISVEGKLKTVVVTPIDFKESLHEDQKEIFDSWWGTLEVMQA